ncbi:short-chain dehydrogenase [Pleurocapsa sp. CCALA 161]|uniref:SDR family oxidoreductase n=1 Tax=Pleurocapsa sp. CCALA 161 TaxID=2107688 RepID=UPI000D04FD5B|nr:SDR family oxidoreductase [Pleurocapsa sp. CCALA 161]PSB12525.1 short-chain dehydrogenase [Pleurocapsa sp. CCALA 161]
MSLSQKKIALITGANKGIGFEISRQLARLGIKVVMGVRDATRGDVSVNQLLQNGLDVEFKCLDVTDGESIEAIRSYIDKTYGKLDILINNAGICLDSGQKSSKVSLEVIRQTLETNFIGAVAITQALLPLIRKSKAGRIVNMSSGRGSLTQHSDPNCHYAKTLAYNSSKTALNSFTVMLAAELKDTVIKVNSADPDWCRTDMGTEAATHSAEEGADTPVWLATLSTEGFTGGFFNSRTPVPW